MPPRAQVELNEMLEERAKLLMDMAKVLEQQVRWAELLISTNMFGKRLERAVAVLLVWFVLAQLHIL